MDASMHFVREYYLDDISVCDRLIAFFNQAKKLGFTGPGRTGNFEINKKVKDSEDLSVLSIPKGNHGLPSPEESGYQSVFKQFVDFIPKYYRDTEAPWRQPVEFEAPQHFQYYKPGGGYHAWHCDATGHQIERHLVFLLYLNDVPGGGTELQHRKYICEAKQGKVLMFPANFCYPHRSQISQTHEKYILTGWAKALKPK